MLNLFNNCIISSWTYKVITLTLKRKKKIIIIIIIIIMIIIMIIIIMMIILRASILYLRGSHTRWRGIWLEDGAPLGWLWG